MVPFYRPIRALPAQILQMNTQWAPYYSVRREVDDYQFGFRKNHSTTLCTYVFKNVVNYYRQNGSHVFACFIDFSKAFDYVDYWLLFGKLIDADGSVKSVLITRLLASWYYNQLTDV